MAEKARNPAAMDRLPPLVDRLPPLVDPYAEKPKPRRIPHNGVPYSRELATEIIERMTSGESLKSICRDPHMPRDMSVHQWVDENHDGFALRYARARQALAEYWANEIVDIADSVRRGATAEDIQAARLAIDSRKWIVAKLLPRSYGDRVEQILSVEASAEPQDAMAILLQIANDPTQPAATRLRAAEACVGYERPRLSSSVNENRNVISIGEELDRARKRIQRGDGPIIDMEPDTKNE